MLAFLAVAAALAPQAFRSGRDAVDPTIHRSPGGRVELFVDPTHADGSGPARYELRAGGAVVWAREHAFTLRELVLADDGAALGVALPRGESGGELDLVVLGPTGDVRGLHAHDFTPASCTTMLDPYVLDLLHAPRAGVFVARLRRVHDEEWVAFDVATGAEVARTHPTRVLGEAEGYRPASAELLDGPEVFAVAWVATEWTGPDRRTWPVFALLSPRGDVLWHAQGDAIARGFSQAKPALVRAAPGGFEAWSPPERVLRRFEVRRAAGGFESGGATWNVAEVARTALEPDPSDPSDASEREPMPLGRDDHGAEELRRLEAAARAVPSIELVEIGRAALAPPAGAAPGAPAALEVSEATIDRIGRVVVLDHEARCARAFDRDGARLWTAPLALHPFFARRTRRIGVGPAGEVRIEAWGDPDGAFVVRPREGLVRTEIGRTSREFLPGTDRSWAWEHESALQVLRGDAVVATIERLPSRRFVTSVDAVLGLPDGGALVLSDGELATYDAGARPLSTIALPYSGGTGLPPDVPVGPSLPDALTANDRWALVSCWSPDAWLVDRATGAVHVFRAPAVGEEQSCAMAIAPDADEVLVLVRETLVLVRYALPPR